MSKGYPVVHNHQKAQVQQRRPSDCSKQFGNCRSVGDSRPYRREYSPNSPNKKTNVEQRTTLQGISVCLWERRNGRGIFTRVGGASGNKGSLWLASE
jgi:hypothetical protein